MRPNRSGRALPLLKARPQRLPCSRRCSATPTVLGVPKQNIAASGKSKIAEAVRYAFTRRDASSRTMSGAFPPSPALSFTISLALEVGEIPRPDRGDDADRLLDCDVPLVRLASPLTRWLPRQPFDIGRATEDPAFRLGQRLSHLHGQDRGVVVVIGDLQVVELAKNGGTLLAGLLRLLLQRLVSGVHDAAPPRHVSCLAGRRSPHRSRDW